MKIAEFNDIIETNDQTEARHEHLEKIREIVGNAYPNKFDRTKISGEEDTISNIVNFEPVVELVKELKDNTPEGAKPDQELKGKLNEKLKAMGNVRVSGRLAVPPRVMGKAAFVHLSDGKNRLQIYVRKDDAKAIDNFNQKPINEEGKAWELFGYLDHGDFVGVEGFLFLTNTGELSVHVETLQFLSKALLPMPDKMHGIADPELRRRYRYADLIADSLKIEHEENELTTREVFERRAKLISGMRNYLDAHGYIEVETPMLTPKATGAAARAFETHHNALDLTLYARIAPELYLKRLTVGGFEKVYELNRNFRNEGLSHKHNPEFTMLEFYCAYMDVNGMMDFCEEMIKDAVRKANNGSLIVNFEKNEIDFSKFERLSMKDAIVKYWNESLKKVPQWWYGRPKDAYDMTKGKFERWWLDDIHHLVYLAAMSSALHTIIYFFNGEPISTPVHINDYVGTDRVRIAEEFTNIYKEDFDTEIENIKEEEKEKLVVEIFEALTEPVLIQPTFIIDYPKSISPLSKASPENPQIAERFELFINGMECANGFSELNDPVEQYERFVDQMRERESGDAEAMVLDEDYIRALAYGMPPAAGIGIGIDRLVMLLTNRHSIRDVILFPHMRPVTKEEEKASEEEAEKDNQIDG